MNKSHKFELSYVIASDVSSRDGIGVEIYINNEMIIEIFRDDTAMTRTITCFRNDIPLDIMEESLRIFRLKIPWEYICDAQQGDAPEPDSRRSCLSETKSRPGHL
jgi:hypothetical protein